MEIFFLKLFSPALDFSRYLLEKIDIFRIILIWLRLIFYGCSGGMSDFPKTKPNFIF